LKRRELLLYLGQMEKDFMQTTERIRITVEEEEVKVVNEEMIVIVNSSSSSSIITRIEGEVMIDAVVTIMELSIGIIMMVVIGDTTVTSIAVLLLQEITTGIIVVAGEGTKITTRNSTIRNILFYVHSKCGVSNTSPYAWNQCTSLLGIRLEFLMIPCMSRSRRYGQVYCNPGQEYAISPRQN